MADYSKGKIYKLCSDTDNQFYIGSTTQSLEARRSQHVREAGIDPIRAHKHFNSIGWGSVGIVLVEEYPCESSEKLRARERYWIEILGPSLNVQMPYRTDEEKRKLNTETTRRLVSSAFNRDYVKEVLTCECGASYQRQWKAQHEKSASHRTFMANGSSTRVRCECGGQYRDASNSRYNHHQTQKHKAWKDRVKLQDDEYTLDDVYCS